MSEKEIEALERKTTATSDSSVKPTKNDKEGPP